MRQSNDQLGGEEKKQARIEDAEGGAILVSVKTQGSGKVVGIGEQWGHR